MIGLVLAGCSGASAPSVPVETVPDAPPAAEAPVPPPPPPSRAAEVVKLMETCLHYAGEEPYDEARAKAIAQNLEATCGPALEAISGVQAELAAKPGSAAALVDFIGHHGSVPGVAVDAALCDRAAEHYRGALEARPGALHAPYFAAVCPEQAEATCGSSRCQ